MKRITIVGSILFLLALVVMQTGSAANALALSDTTAKAHNLNAAKKPLLPKPVFVGGTAAYNSAKNQVVFTGYFKVKTGKKWVVVHSTTSWSKLVLQDASLAPLPVQATSGFSNTIQLSIKDAYGAQATFVVSTPKVTRGSSKQPAHQAAKTKPIPVLVYIGGYSAVGTEVPASVGVVLGDTPKCDWVHVIDSPDSSPTMRIAPIVNCTPVTGKCHIERMDAQPATDYLPNRDGVSNVGQTFYPIKVVCHNDDSGVSYWAVPYITVDIEYSDGHGGIGDNCQFTVSGVFSYTMLPEWDGWFVSFYAGMATFDSNNQLVATAQSVQTDFQLQRTKGSVEVCQAYGLGKIHG